jgi:hypothetical protein
MKLDNIIKEIQHIGNVLKAYRYPLIGLIIVVLFAFTVFRIDYLSATQRDEEAYQEQIKTVKSIDFDQTIIDKILKLQDTDTNIQSNFPGSRINPF